jgi:SAM-dependent methyltransferase
MHKHELLSSSDYKRLVNLEKKWMGRIPRNQETWDWQPFPLDDFISMCQVVADAFPAGVTPSFLDPGCGIGTKVFVAQQIFGFEATGFDIVPEYVWVAHKELGLIHQTVLGDVDTCRAYDMFDIVWLSRPFRDDKREFAYELRVQNEMKPGAFLISGWAAAKPQWEMYYRGPWKGVWRKPLDGKPVEPLPLAPIPHGTTLAEGTRFDPADTRPPTGGQWKYDPSPSPDYHRADASGHDPTSCPHGHTNGVCAGQELGMK